ncbi:MAG TPA: hypothetical protein VLG46_03195, partial [Anaerolineae bacterium]|nr:hypothetical protein [Anaerolineae bacterium]
MIDSTQLESEVLALREQLARLEQEHADLRVELNEFELLYNARVGPSEAKLAEVQLHSDEYQLRIELVQWRGKSLSPIQLEAEVEHRLREQRERAEAIHANADIARSFVPSPPIDPATGLDLKQVYRELAKRTHPDLASDEADRALRSQRMVDVNALYARQDLEGLRRILRQLETGRLAPNETPEQRLARLKDERLRLDAAIRHVKAEIADLNRDPLMALKLEAALGRSRGQDVLAETARQMQAKLAE